MSAVVLTVAVAAGAAQTATSSATASGSSKAATAHVLSQVGRFADVVTTDQGISVAMWSATYDRTRLEWAVKRPGKPWTRAKVKGDWAVSPFTHGLPQLTSSSGHRVTATWLDRRRRVVVENWSPTHGWSKPVHLSNARHTAWDPRIVSNAAGMVAIAWSQQNVGFHDPQFARVAVRRDGAWGVKQVGRKKNGGFPGLAVQLGMAADGAVTAAWENVPPGDDHPVFLARRLPAGTATWEPAHDFGGVFAEWFNAGDFGLAVQPDGSAMLSRPSDSPDGYNVYVRVGDGGWVDQGATVPFWTTSLSLPSGALFTLLGFDMFEDPDGIAGPAPLASVPGPGFVIAREYPQVLVTSDGTLVALTRTARRLEYAVRPVDGDWSAVRTAYRTTRNIQETWSSSMSSDGQVTVLFGTRPAGSSGHHPLRMEAIRFDARPTT